MCKGLCEPFTQANFWPQYLERGGQVQESRLQTQSQRGRSAGTGGVGHAISNAPGRGKVSEPLLSWEDKSTPQGRGWVKAVVGKIMSSPQDALILILGPLTVSFQEPEEIRFRWN